MVDEHMAVFHIATERFEFICHLMKRHKELLFAGLDINPEQTIIFWMCFAFSPIPSAFVSGHGAQPCHPCVV